MIDAIMSFVEQLLSFLGEGKAAEIIDMIKEFLAQLLG